MGLECRGAGEQHREQCREPQPFLSCRMKPIQSGCWICPFKHRDKHTFLFLSPLIQPCAQIPWLYHLYPHLTQVLFPEWLLLPSPVSIEKMLHSRIFLKRRSVWLEDKCVRLFFPALGSLQPVRADLIQEGSNSDFLIPPWKKCLAHSGCRVLSLRGEAAPLRKGTEFRVQGRATGFCFCSFQRKECCGCEGCPIMFCWHPGH